MLHVPSKLTLMGFALDCLEPQLRCYVPYRTAARAFALAASSSRFLGGAFVSSECNKRWAISATPSTAAKNAASFVFDGFENPLIFLTNWIDAARTSSSLTGGSKLNKGRIFLHIMSALTLRPDDVRAIIVAKHPS